MSTAGHPLLHIATLPYLSFTGVVFCATCRLASTIAANVLGSALRGMSSILSSLKGGERKKQVKAKRSRERHAG
ncbi:hypothetical protein B0T16DRAFT_421815 [Cercophora newfieldiana]|uniref:Uncharacterized protein n=1 Tax=Cercophora newfieldiana TaxID=92897 RepID=A0AA39XSX5_9PEZI|nr:hypothetical protein B0T16DRAFT_421815 [Cercophora newfieldiana]